MYCSFCLAGLPNPNHIDRPFAKSIGKNGTQNPVTKTLSQNSDIDQLAQEILK
jgi:hypothetical protein